MRFVVVTGLSGAGKSTTLNFLEDRGYYCVDNLPVQLISEFAKLISENGEIERAALGIDVRTGSGFDELESALEKIKDILNKLGAFLRELITKITGAVQGEEEETTGA